MRVLVLARDPVGRMPAQRFRFEQYVGPLAARGIAMEFEPLMAGSTTDVLYEPGHVGRKVAGVARGAGLRLAQIGRSRRYDVAFVAREGFPLGPAWVERALTAAGLPFVFDFDDAVWLPHGSAANRLIAPLKFAGKTASACRLATVVTAGNGYLAEWARRFNPRVRVLPTTVDTDRFRRESSPEPRPDPLVIGWSGSHSTAAHLRPLMPVLADLQRRRGVRLVVIGAPPFAAEGAEVEFVPWTEADEVEQLGRLDIGVMPLPDTEWARGKCGLKALTYMALGIPTVMSPVGVNVDIAQGGAAWLADGPQEWTSALERLLDEPDTRRELGAAGRRRVEERYSVTRNVQGYADALQEAVALGGRRA
jgi:glycosyltransferase involved in cell wall biosynthesis